MRDACLCAHWQRAHLEGRGRCQYRDCNCLEFKSQDTRPAETDTPAGDRPSLVAVVIAFALALYAVFNAVEIYELIGGLL